jgi:serine/threonine protein kinase
MFFGPIPSSYDDQVEGRPELQQVFLHMFEITPPDQLEQFRRIAKHQISDDDKAFLQKCMKWDWRDRPTVKELLEDEWFKDVVGA